KENNITTIVAVPEQGKSNENGTQPEYFVSNFIYNKEQNTYTCPQGQTLTTTGRRHKKTGRTEESGYMFQKYRTSACKTCAVKDLCTSRKGGREIDRSQYAEAVEENHKRYKDNAQLYRKRQEINEHIFGTIKRKWGYNYTDLVGLEKVNGEHSLIMLVYNIKRSINILGVPDLIAKLQAWNTPYKRKAWLFIKTTYLKLFLAQISFGTNQNTSKCSFA
ncbi:MAG: transposase, partial [Flavobacteriaceae bacterium]